MQTTTPGRIDLNRNPDESVVLHALVLPIAENAAGAAGAVIPVQIIPPPGPGGVLPARDGRRQRVPDIAALVARLNRQSVAARVDTDHHSEPTSPRFKGTTAADGWLSNYRVDSAGGITADMEPNPGLREKIREKRYRYASPALFLREDGEVLGLSSLALVNDPNMPLRAPVMHSLARREAELARRKAAVERTLNRAAEMVVDTAILGGDIAAHHRDYYLGAIRSHEEGIGAGVNAFVELSRSGGLQPPVRFTTPFGCEEPRAERLELHNQIAHRASRQSTTYLEAAAEFAAETREVAIPEGWQAPRGARMALHRQISANALESGVPYREAAERTEDYARVTVPTGWQAPREARMALHAALARFALELGIPYREAITRLAGAPTGTLELHAKSAYERMEKEIERAMVAAKAIPMAELERRARAAVDSAKVLAEKGEWMAACTALTDAKEILSAAEDVHVGDFRALERALTGAAPTPEQYMPPKEVLIKDGSYGRDVLITGLRRGEPSRRATGA